MLTALAAVSSLSVSVFLLLCGNGLLFALLPLRAEVEGFSDLSVGLLGSGYFLGMMIGCLVSPSLIRFAGHVRAFAAASAIMTVAPLIHVLAPEPVFWIVIRVLAGLCQAVLFAVIESWMNEKADNTYRGQILAIYNVINYAGLSLGQQFLRLYEPSGHELFLLGAILLSLAAVPVALTRSAAAALPESPRLRLVWLYRLSPVGVLTAAGVGIANGSFFSFAPLFGSEIGLSSSQIASFFSLSLAGAVITLWPLGRLSDMIDRRYVIIGTCLIAALVGWLLFSVATTQGPDALLLIYALGLCFGAFAMPIYALAGAHAADFAEKEELVEVATGLLLVYTLGATIGPTLVSLLNETVSPLALFAFIGAVHMSMALVAAWRMTRREALPADERDAFIAVPRTSPGAIELAPSTVSYDRHDHDVPFPAEAEPLYMPIDPEATSHTSHDTPGTDTPDQDKTKNA
ncbi:MAG: MFS transporter [Pseudomonadota bacterium]